MDFSFSYKYRLPSLYLHSQQFYDYKANQVMSPFLTHVQITITLGFPKRKLVLLNIFSPLA